MDNTRDPPVVKPVKTRTSIKNGWTHGIVGWDEKVSSQKGTTARWDTWEI